MIYLIYPSTHILVAVAVIVLGIQLAHQFPGAVMEADRFGGAAFKAQLQLRVVILVPVL
jgi:hypothetical protein